MHILWLSQIFSVLIRHINTVWSSMEYVLWNGLEQLARKDDKRHISYTTYYSWIGIQNRPDKEKVAPYITAPGCSNISRTIVGNKIVDHSDVAGSCGQCTNCIFILNLTPAYNGLGNGNWKTRRETLSVGIWCAYIRYLTVAIIMHYDVSESIPFGTTKALMALFQT